MADHNFQPKGHAEGLFCKVCGRDELAHKPKHQPKHPDYYNKVLEDLGIEGIIVTIDPDSRHLMVDFPTGNPEVNLAEYLIPRLLHHLAVLWHKDQTLQYASDIITKSYLKNQDESPLEGEPEIHG